MHQRSTARIMRSVALTVLLVILSVLVWNCVRPLTGSGSSATCGVGTNLRYATSGSYFIQGILSASSNPVFTRTDRTEFNAARRVLNVESSSDCPMKEQSRCPAEWCVDKVCRPASGLVTITTLLRRAGSSSRRSLTYASPISPAHAIHSATKARSRRSVLDRCSFHVMTIAQKGCGGIDPGQLARSRQQKRV